MSCGADTSANELLTSLTTGVSFPVPVIDLDADDYAIPAATGPLFGTVTKLDNEDLTTRTVDGTGTFDALMSGFAAHLKNEFELSRITGAEYTKAFIALTEGAMGNATQFLLGRETAYWQALAAQLQAQTNQVQLVTARVQLATAKAQLQALSYQAKTEEANYALTKMKIATEDVNYCTAKYNLDSIMPQQLTNLIKQGAQLDAETAGKVYENTNLLPAQLANLTKQGTQLDAETAKTTYETANILPSQKTVLDKQALQIQGETSKTAYELSDVLPAQKLLLGSQKSQVDAEAAAKLYETANLAPEQKSLLIKQQTLTQEQTEVQRAQTMDTRTDGVTTVVGVLGKQKDLYAQQITSYMRDAEVKAAKLFTDAWITQKTIDEGLLAPTNFQNSSVDAILADLKTNNALG